ncbi:hypothetical protein [Halorussus sp. MSC15.2]|uniref:hypothetical protein n=1 Tax=Halorussus sp. MSC15.2 TaxID=2283638 RepID=UPI0013D75113|nr:hypothetical protein [Halorussus sp. MSC15.2]NEU56894.1 hypothetical protein [Halorussus sp. MSC15.2]
MVEKSNPDSSVRRRDVLKTAATTGAAAFGFSGQAIASDTNPEDVTAYRMQDPATETGNRTVRIQTKQSADYRFGVTGLLSATDAPTDAVDAGKASATLERGVHEFQFSGEFTEFELNGEAKVTVNGEPFDVAAFPHNTLKIIPSGKVEFDVSASGGLEVTGGSVERPSTRRATGYASGKVTVAYEGELTYFDIDGDAELTKNGTSVTSETVLPSTQPHVAHIETTRGSHEFDLVVGDDASVTDSVTGTTAEGGTVSGRAVNKPTQVSYSGQTTQFQRDDGAKMVFDDPSNKVKLHAPTDDSAEFTPRATEGIAYESEVREAPTVTVPAGEMRQLKYFGDILGGDIGSLRLSLSHDEYPAAADSALLQLSAEVQRHSAFSELTTNAAQDGRVRYDVGGISGGRIRPSDSGKDLTFASHALTDLERGTKGNLVLSVTNDGSVEQAENTLKWENDRGTIQKMEVRELQRGASTSATGSSFETDEHNFNIPKQPRRAETQGWVPDPSDWLDPLWDGLDALADSFGVAADLLKSGIQNAIDNVQSLTKEDIILKSGEIVIDNLRGAAQMAWSLIDELSNSVTERRLGKVLMGLNIVGSFGVAAFVGTDVFGALDRGDHDCAACIAAVKIAFEVMCGLVGKGVCAAVGAFTALVGGAACQIVVEAACAYATLALPDAQKICSGDAVVLDDPVCTP